MEAKGLYMTNIVASDKLQEWARYFKVVGSPIRLLIILSIYGSEILKHSSCSLTFSDIKEISGVPTDETLVYHLKQLEGVDFISKEAHKDEKSGRVYPLYHMGERGRRFISDLGLSTLVSESLKKTNVQ